MARLVEQVVVLWTSLASARFGSVGSVRDEIVSESSEQLGAERSVQGGLICGESEMGCPLSEGVAGSLEADAFDVGVVRCGGDEHERTDEVVGD